MDFLFLTGIIMAVVPALVIIGFSIFVFLSFIRDDKDASNIARTAFIVMIIGIALIIWHYASKSLL